MTNDEIAKGLEELTIRFDEGWHEGITIDASDIMLLAEATIVIRNIAALPVPEVQWRDLTIKEIRDLEVLPDETRDRTPIEMAFAVIAKFKEKQL